MPNKKFIKVEQNGKLINEEVKDTETFRLPSIQDIYNLITSDQLKDIAKAKLPIIMGKLYRNIFFNS